MPTGGPKRLCILFHESEVLGAGVSVLRAIDGLVEHGWVCSGWFPGEGPLVGKSERLLVRHGVREKPLAFSLRGWRRDPGVARRLRRTPAYLRAFDRWLASDAPDVVHANSLLMLLEATLARRRGMPIVVQVHELPPPSRKRDLSLRWAASVADVLVGVSGPVSAMLRRHAGRTPVLTVRNGVPVETATQPTNDTFVVGSIGHVSRTKGTDVFLEAARLALEVRPQLRFEHVGPGRIWDDDAFDSRVETLAASAPLRDALGMLGRQPAAEALSRWSLFVLPSRQEAFPLATLEAMAAGVPVIATAVGGLPEQVAHLETGILVAPGDPGIVAEWIVKLHDDSDLRSGLADRAREHVHRSFPLKAQAEGLERAYETAISRSLRRHRVSRIARSRAGDIR
jgi:glycosyltransferase involved in cell wall biosynthesis